MRTVVIAALVISASLSQALAQQCRSVPLGVTEQEFVRGYERRMRPTGAGDLALISTLSGNRRMYAHIAPRQTSRAIHTVAIETRDDMVRQVFFIDPKDGPDALTERIRIGAASVMMLTPGTTEAAALAAIDAAVRRMRSSNARAMERVGEAAVIAEPSEGDTLISVGRLRC